MTLSVLQEVSNATAETQFGAPVISTREARTQLLIKDGQTAVIGGLIDQTREKTSSGIPILKASLPTATQSRMQPRLGEVVDRTAFGPREVRVVVTAVPPGATLGAELTADVLLAGGTAVSLRRVVERLRAPDARAER